MKLPIVLDHNENINIREKKTRLVIYQNPLVFIQLFDSHSIIIDLIDDNLFYIKKQNDLRNYDYKVYSTKNKDNELRYSYIFEFEKFNDKPIEIENENIYPYFFIMNSKIPELKEEDLLYKNIYRRKKRQTRKKKIFLI